MLSYPQAAEPLLELVLGAAVIIGMEHAKEHALAETARADEEEVIGLILQHRNVHGLVHVILVALYHIQEV